MNQPTRYNKIGFLDFIWHFKYQLGLYIVGISFFTFVGLYLIGGVPSELKVVDQSQASSTDVVSETTESESETQIAAIPKVQLTTTVDSQSGELPQRVMIEKSGINVTVANPTSQNVNALNNALLKGAARYPGSGTLGHGNMFIMAHSSHLRIVNNQAYKAFNNLEKLNIGDTILVESASKTYTYSVISIELTNADDGYIDLKAGENMLTLVTCNVLGEKAERFMVKAVFVK